MNEVIMEYAVIFKTSAYSYGGTRVFYKNQIFDFPYKKQLEGIVSYLEDKLKLKITLKPKQ